MTALNVLTVACAIASGVTAVVYLVGVYSWLLAGAALQRLGLPMSDWYVIIRAVAWPLVMARDWWRRR
jgi:hypothetical protein